MIVSSVGEFCLLFLADPTGLSLSPSKQTIVYTSKKKSITLERFSQRKAGLTSANLSSLWQSKSEMGSDCTLTNVDMLEHSGSQNW